MSTYISTHTATSTTMIICNGDRDIDTDCFEVIKTLLMNNTAISYTPVPGISDSFYNDACKHITDYVADFRQKSMFLLKCDPINSYDKLLAVKLSCIDSLINSIKPHVSQYDIANRKSIIIAACLNVFRLLSFSFVVN